MKPAKLTMEFGSDRAGVSSTSLRIEYEMDPSSLDHSFVDDPTQLEAEKKLFNGGNDYASGLLDLTVITKRNEMPDDQPGLRPAGFLCLSHGVNGHALAVSLLSHEY